MLLFKLSKFYDGNVGEFIFYISIWLFKMYMKDSTKSRLPFFVKKKKTHTHKYS